MAKIKNTLFQHKLVTAYHSLSDEIQDVDFPQYRDLTFTEFWYKLNEELGVKMELFDYEKKIIDAWAKTKYHWIKKATGLGITELTIRWIAWNCLKDNVWRDQQVDINVVMVTGPRIDLSITIMNRLKSLFEGHEFRTKETVCKLNGNRIEAFPSHHLSSARGLNPRIVFLDEADFFPVGQQQEARDVSERYIAKTDPHILLVSTPNLPGGLFDNMEQEKDSMYNRMTLLYPTGENKIYTPEGIAAAKLSPSFEREYNGKYGYGVGDIFIEIDEIIEEYETVYVGGRAGTYADPAFGFSKFGLVSGEVRNGIVYITEAEEYVRESPSLMLDVMEESYNKHKQSCKVDAAHPGFIKDLNERGVPALAVAFGSQVPESEGISRAKESSYKNETLITLKKKMPIVASLMVKRRKVRIHPQFTALISQMRAVKFDKKGGIDKEEVSFDLIDALDMCLYDLKEIDYTSIGLTHDGKYTDHTPKRISKGLTVTTTVIEP